MHVGRALRVCLNHSSYKDLLRSQKNLKLVVHLYEIKIKLKRSA